MKRGSSVTHTGTTARSEGLLDEILDRMRRGEVLDADSLAAEHPERAEEVRQLLAVVRFVHAAAAKADPVADLDARVHLMRDKPALGDFEIIREVGRGGMGVVYEAVQKSLDRRVAVKVLLPGATLTGDALARFEREARTAGALQHEHIVPIYAVGDAGGVPYYAMQFVDGESLSNLLKRMRGEERSTDFDYFRRVAEWGRQVSLGLDHAHQRGIVHRDVKPSNLMVDSQDKVWITDFGLARQDTNLTITATGDVVGTAMYMSPEQARGGGRRVDERTDVYSLGVTLYELISLRPPFEGPDRESTLKQVLLEDAKPLRRLNRTIPRRLETIVAKAIEKEPERRYATAAFLAEDLRRYLADEPILARPPSLGEQLIRLASRHRMAAGFVAAILVLTTMFGVLATLQALRIDRERQRAVKAERDALASSEQSRIAAEKAERTNEFLQELLQSANPVTENRDPTVREMLERAVAVLEARPHPDADVEAALRHTIGKAFLSLGRMQESERQLSRAVEIIREANELPTPSLFRALVSLGETQWARGRQVAAEKTCEQAITVGAAVFGESGLEIGQALNLRGVILAHTGRMAEGEAAHRRSVEIFRAHVGEQQAQLPTALENLAHLLVRQAKFAEAEPLLDEAISLRRELAGRTGGDLAETMTILANIRWQRGDAEAAESLLREALAMNRERLPADHPHIAINLNNLAQVLSDRGLVEEARAMLAEAIELMRESLGAEHSTTLTAMDNLALCDLRLGNLDAAETAGRDILGRRTRLLGERHPDTIDSLSFFGACLVARRDHAAAEGTILHALDLGRAVLGENHPLIAGMWTSLGRSYLDRDAGEEAERAFRSLLECTQAMFGDQHPDLAAGMTMLGRALHIQGRLHEAEVVLRGALEHRFTYPPTETWESADTLTALGAVLIDIAQFEEAESVLDEAIELCTEAGKNAASTLAEAMCELGRCRARQGRLDEAEPLLMHALETLQSSSIPSKMLESCLRVLVEVARARGEPDRAREFERMLGKARTNPECQD